MLKPKAIADLLSTANSGGVEAAILFTADGSPISASIHASPTLPLLTNPAAFPSSSSSSSSDGHDVPGSPHPSTTHGSPSSVPTRIAHARAAKTLSAILSNVWFLYEKNARLVDGSVASSSAAPPGSDDDPSTSSPSGAKRPGLTGELRTVFVDVEDGKLAVGRTGGGMVVGVVGRKEVGWGMMRMKLDSLCAQLEEVLSGIPV
ncbi:hypothetical protein M427DRAFT_135017 [Gonapodya prolifera JEL478]|uniref:Roadblock/LAMTOR2 domain-containing protein n=1 Tax=Gonapodya prolifera (strain JEL478) TaxID=1344416 RepID=A0A139AG45_GONPJ|nr:hypothetical protein M427DRAFT_135017 [Gonapodya prolifera JEL478]|eukprot:KXS15534.1 hypothetical protein M427DRAFT_135017 [Gonapodya prolifera JEL478]